MTWLWQHLWPGWDQVYPNILASAICGSAVWLWARRHLHRLHRRNEAIHAKAADTNRLTRVLADRLGIDPDTAEDRLPPPRY